MIMSSTQAVRRHLLHGLLVLRSFSLSDTQVTSYFVAVTKGSIRKGRLWSDSHFAGTVHPGKEGVTSELRKLVMPCPHPETVHPASCFILPGNPAQETALPTLRIGL